MTESLEEFLPSWMTTIAPHQTLGTKALASSLVKMMRAIRGEFSEAGFSEKFSGWLQSEGDKFLKDAAWLTKHAEDFSIDWWSESLTESYLAGRNAVRELFERAMGHLIVAYVDTLWHPLVNETLVASKSLEEFGRALETAEVLAAIIGSDRSAALWWHLGQTHHDYINRRRDGSLGTGTFVGDPIFYTTLAFAVVPGTDSCEKGGDGENEAIEAWQSDEVQSFWCTAGHLMGGQAPRWTKFSQALELYRAGMKAIAKDPPKTISEMMESYPPKVRLKQF